jgi:hypothetical protein
MASHAQLTLCCADEEAARKYPQLGKTVTHHVKQGGLYYARFRYHRRRGAKGVAKDVKFDVVDGDVNKSMYAAVLVCLQGRYKPPGDGPAEQPYYKTSKMLKAEAVAVAAAAAAAADAMGTPVAADADTATRGNQARKRGLDRTEAARKARMAKAGITGAKKRRKQMESYFASVISEVNDWIEAKKLLIAKLVKLVENREEHLLVAGGSQHLAEDITMKQQSRLAKQANACVALYRAQVADREAFVEFVLGGSFKDLRQAKARWIKSDEYQSEDNIFETVAAAHASRLAVSTLKTYDRQLRQHDGFIPHKQRTAPRCFILIHDDVRESLTSWLKRNPGASIPAVRGEINNILTAATHLSAEMAKQRLTPPVSRDTAHRWRSTVARSLRGREYQWGTTTLMTLTNSTMEWMLLTQRRLWQDGMVR